MDEQIHDSMELVRSNEQSYKLELHTYRTAFPDFKYKPLSFVSMEIGTNSRVPITPFVVQPIAITKLRGGIGLEIIFLII
jgi:hypothetical protein